MFFICCPSDSVKALEVFILIATSFKYDVLFYNATTALGGIWVIQ